MFGLLILGEKPMENYQVYGENRYLFLVPREFGNKQAVVYLCPNYEFQKYSCVTAYCTTGNEQAGRIGRLDSRTKSTLFTIPKSPETGDMFIFLEVNAHPPLLIPSEAPAVEENEEDEVMSPRGQSGSPKQRIAGGQGKFSFEDLCHDDKFRAVFMRDILMERPKDAGSEGKAGLLAEAEDKIAKLEKIERLKHGHLHNEKLQDVMEWIETTFLDQVDDDPCFSDELDQKSATLRGRLHKLRTHKSLNLSSLTIIPSGGEAADKEKEKQFVIETFVDVCSKLASQIRTEARHTAKRRTIKEDPMERMKAGKEYLFRVDRTLNDEIEQVTREFPGEVVFLCMKGIYNEIFDLLTWLQSLYFENLPDELMGEGAERTKHIDEMLKMLHGARAWESMASTDQPDDEEDEEDEFSSDLDEDAPEFSRKLYHKLKVVEDKIDQTNADIGDMAGGRQNTEDLKQLLNMVSSMQRQLNAMRT